MADALVELRARKEGQVASGTIDEVDDAGVPIRFNTKRFLNVLFGEKIKTFIATRGRVLTKQQLEDKLSTDQQLFEEFVDEYNDESVDPYGAHAHPSVDDFQDATKFQSVPSTQWKKACKKVQRSRSRI